MHLGSARHEGAKRRSGADRPRQRESCYAIAQVRGLIRSGELAPAGRYTEPAPSARVITSTATDDTRSVFNVVIRTTPSESAVRSRNESTKVRQCSAYDDALDRGPVRPA